MSEMLLETTAFVLRTYPLGEADRIVVLLSREAGQLRCVAPRAASSRKRFGGALAVLAEVEVRVRTRPGRELGRLESCTVIHPTPGEGRDLEAYYAASYLAEVADTFTREAEADDRLYRLVRACSTELARGAEPYAVCRYFEVWTLKLAGLLPDLVSCPGCGHDLAAGAVCSTHGDVTCRACAGAARGARALGPPVVRRVRAFLAAPPAGALEASSRDLRVIASFAAGQFQLLVDRPFRSAAAVVPRQRRGDGHPVGDPA